VVWDFQVQKLVEDDLVAEGGLCQPREKGTQAQLPDQGGGIQKKREEPEKQQIRISESTLTEAGFKHEMGSNWYYPSGKAATHLRVFASPSYL
jgi:hypothetical protein